MTTRTGSCWVLVLALLAASLAIGGSGRVYAHADLLRAEPAVDSKVAKPPTQLTLYFSQALKHEGSFIQIEDSSGTRIPVQVSFDEADAKVMRAAVSGLSPGVYTVKWQSLSAGDDDYHDATYSLTVLNPDGSVPQGGSTATPIKEDESGAGDTLILMGVIAVVVAMLGGLVYLLRRTAPR